MSNDFPDIQFHKGQAVADAVFSILIPSWNNLAFLQLCVESIRRHSHYPHQIIVHINEGQDGSLGWVREQQLDHTFSSENVGVCRALNAARQLMQTEYLLFLNDDMYCCPDWDLPLWTTLQQQSDLHFFLSATMIEPYASGNPAVLAPHDFGQHPQQFREQDLLQSLPHLQKHDWNGASWPPNLVHVSLWDAVGGYSEEYSPGFYSDPDFAFKLWALGVRRFIGLGDSRVYHFGRQSTRRIAAGKGKRIFLKKWGITPSVFYQHYLRMGSPFDGPLPEPTVSWSLRWARLRCWVKSFL